MRDATHVVVTEEGTYNVYYYTFAHERLARIRFDEYMCWRQLWSVEADGSLGRLLCDKGSFAHNTLWGAAHGLNLDKRERWWRRLTSPCPRRALGFCRSKCEAAILEWRWNRLMASDRGRRLMETSFRAFQMVDEKAKSLRGLARAEGALAATSDAAGVAGSVCIIVGISFTCTGVGAAIGAPIAIAGVALGGASGAAGLILSIGSFVYSESQISSVDERARTIMEEHGEAMQELLFLEQLEETRNSQPSSALTPFGMGLGLYTTVSSTRDMVQAGRAGLSLGVRDSERAITHLVKFGKNAATKIDKAGGIAMAGVGMLLNLYGILDGLSKAWTCNSTHADRLHQLADVYLKLGLKMKGYAGGWPGLTNLRPSLRGLKLLRLEVEHFECHKVLTMPFPKNFELSLKLREGPYDRYVRSPAWRRGTPGVLEFRAPLVEEEMFLEVWGNGIFFSLASATVPCRPHRSPNGSHITYQLLALADF